MDKSFLRVVTYGSLLELVSDPKYYYHSVAGKDYSHLTDNGRQAVLDLIETFAYNMIEVSKQEDEQRSRDIVINELKGKHDTS
jgi:hypothetical protein